MNKRNTAIIISLIIGMAGIIIYLSYKSNFPDQEKIVNNNLENIKRVETGMSESEVEKIMGKPYKIIPIDAPEASTRYDYKIPKGVDAICTIAFDSTMHVVDVFFEIIEEDVLYE